MRKLLTFLVLVLALNSFGASKVRQLLTITNLPVTGNNLSYSAPATKVITWSNLNSSAYALTNTTVNGCATNLFLQMAAYAPWTPRPGFVWANTNAFWVEAECLSVIVATNSGAWLSATYDTNDCAALLAVRVPISAEKFSTSRVYIASEVVRGISDYSTNPIAGLLLTNIPSFTGTMRRATNGYFTNSIIDRPQLTNGVADGLWLTNGIRLHATNHLLYGGTIEAATITNSVLTNVASLQGTLLALTNGLLDGSRLTNITSFDGTIRRATNGYYTNSILDNATLTNAVNYGNAFSSKNTNGTGEQFGQSAIANGIGVPTAVGVSTEASGDTASAFAYLAIASGDRSLAAGTETEASGEDSTAVASFARATKPRTSSFGYNALAGHTNGTAIGAFAETDAEDQLMLGSSTVAYVKAYGRLAAGSITNTYLTGTNQTTAGWGWTEKVISSLANSNNILDPGTDSVFIRLSAGPTTTYGLNSIQRPWNGRPLKIWNDTGSPVTVYHQNGFDAGNPQNWIISSTGGDVVLGTNDVIDVIYSASRARWLYDAGRTNPVSIANNSITDGHLRDSAALSVIGRSVNSSGDPADIAAGGSGLFLASSNSILTWIPAYLPAGAGTTNEQLYANSTTTIPFTANGFTATTTNIMQVKHAGGAIVGRVDTNGYWLTGMDFVCTNVTTDGTITTLGSLTMPNNSMARVDCWVNGSMSDFSNIGSYQRAAHFVCTNSTASMVGSVVTTGGAGEHNSAWDCTLDASGQTFRIRVTGAAATTVKWSAVVRVYPQLF